MFRRITIGRTFDGIEYRCQIRVQIGIGVGSLGDVAKQLTGINEISFGLGGIVLYLRRDEVIREMNIIHALVASLYEVVKFSLMKR